MIVQVRLGESSYDVVIEHGCLGRAGELLQGLGVLTLAQFLQTFQESA